MAIAAALALWALPAAASMLKFDVDPFYKESVLQGKFGETPVFFFLGPSPSMEKAVTSFIASADKTLDGYDWTNLRMPADWGRAQLENLDFVAGCEDLVLYGPVGTGKSHLAIAIGRLACERGVPVRFFTATGLLMRLRRAQQENRLDRELASIGKARLLIIDEFGYLPIDEEGSRLLFQIISDSYETRSIIYTTNIEFSGWGRVLGDKNMAAALIDRTVHHGRLIRFEGRSYRSEHALMTK